MVRRNKNNLKLVIIDRDGTLNVFREGYIKEPEEWEPVPGALEAIALLNRSGWHVVVASNQPAVGRGVMDAATLHAIHAVMHKQLAAVGARIDAVFLDVLLPAQPGRSLQLPQARARPVPGNRRALRGGAVRSARRG
jgi:histidinol-phosphate phosphatase family protein